MAHGNICAPVIRNPHIDQKQSIRGFFIYVSNEENALLAEAFDEYRDNHRETHEAPVF